MIDDPAAVPFDRGLIALEKYLLRQDESGLSGAIAEFRQAATLAPENAACWTALGYCIDAGGENEEALAALRQAARLDPENEAVEVLVLNLLAESGAEREALLAVEAAAMRQDVDLDALRRELTAAHMPVDADTIIRNAFVHARHHLRSWLEDEIDRAHRTADPVAWERRREVEQRECEEMQDEVRRGIRPERVPESFRDATPWAARLGVGDDVCRRMLAAGLTAAERSELLQAVNPRAPMMHAWLDGFGSDGMPPEAAAFLYLLLGIEEMQHGV